MIDTTTVKTKDIDRSLCKKGFECVKDSDHVRYILYVNGVKTRIRTKMSHGENEIGDNLVLKMSHQLKLSKSGFMDLIRCPLSKEEYVKILRESDEIERAGKSISYKRPSCQ